MKRRVILYKATLDHHDILRNYGVQLPPSPMKEEALRILGTKMWLESNEYDYFSEVMEDVKFEIIHDIAAMQYKALLFATVPEDMYAYYLMREK